MKVVAVSGYKGHELGIFNQKHEGIRYIKKAIRQRIISLIDEGLEWVIISGQLGVELWAAETVYDLQTDYPNLKVAVLTPFLNQEKNWNEETQEYYQHILGQADFVESISKKEYENPTQLRMKNEYIIQKSDGLLLLYDEEKEGSPLFYLKPAKKRQAQENYIIVMITPYDLELIVEEEREAQQDFW
ncbi:DUF1273 domain-containing protein [Bacillus sp. FJAT-45350]|uniref:DUF1273 domain-containing protein n=1 Tax=Bacillus sp. FJAT-45350 TaxID=2011014 RepID=UPI000BB7ECE9|nr:DUF1273 domain-containing protein [Bacillus sp. FJAT-45350]